ncbi:MAG: phosphatidylinositol alpha 1,6-mannosyltransferase [Streptosporangiaceae bacterium]|nr:phosphatidylinositol alpha 1,6-mannosyltransferase [Streptosporangiaceae bacterium]
MRIGIITESFPPEVNGVAHSVLRVAEHLVARGHQPLVIAPQPATGCPADTRPGWPPDTQPGCPADTQHGFPVIRVRSVPFPGYRSVRLGLASPAIQRALVAHRAELVHLASPFFLGALGSRSARRVRLPVVAVYQTDVPGYARAYHWGRVAEAAAWRWLAGIHNAADRTLAPSTPSIERLAAHGVQRIWLWGRGVDVQRFSPANRSDPLRQALAPDGEVLAGYVGRLAPEKQVELLAGVAALPGVRLVIVGSGPAEARLRRLMPSAVFLGQHRGEQLARIFASLDVFVHSGCHETFGQTIQEAAASGLPVVAPAVGGPVDLVEDGVTGYLVPPGDAGALTAATRRLAADPPGRAAMGRAGRQRVLARSWTALGDQLIGHYAAVLGERSGAWSAGELAGDERDAVTPRDLLAGGQVGRARLGVVHLR